MLPAVSVFLSFAFLLSVDLSSSLFLSVLLYLSASSSPSLSLSRIYVRIHTHTHIHRGFFLLSVFFSLSVDVSILLLRLSARSSIYIRRSARTRDHEECMRVLATCALHFLLGVACAFYTSSARASERADGRARAVGALCPLQRFAATSFSVRAVEQR